jgi:ribosomal protein S18 acetylase RimI-like enzyme
MSSPNLIIQRATETDLIDLQSISILTFRQAFEQFNTADDMQLYLENCLSIEQLNKEMETEVSSFFLAKIDGETIGYLKLNCGISDQNELDGQGLEIERIYVVEEYHGAGIGQELYSIAEEKATEIRATHLWLGVWEHNPRAIRFYEKLGFEPFGNQKFILGKDIQTDILMRLSLV